jgi:hypothetical protein
MGRYNVPQFNSLISLLCRPQRVSELADAQWNDVIEQGRKTQLLGQLAAQLRQAGVLEQVLPAVLRHLTLDELTARRRSEAALWEFSGIRRAIDLSIPIVALKGCAYAAAKDANASGRLFSDVDVMVRRHDLPAVESALFGVGWKPSRVNAYDSAYYRDWMHEVPPMEHVRRHTVVDLHHAINPPVSRYYVNPEQLFACLVEVMPGIFVLSVQDRIIHCALHLLQEGETKKLIRELYDLHLLLHQHCDSPERIQQLEDRADVLQVGGLLRTAVGAARTLFSENPGHHHTRWLQGCVERAAHMDSKNTLLGELSGLAILAHSHWMKMPMRLLVPHLARKTWLKWFPEKD